MLKQIEKYLSLLLILSTIFSSFSYSYAQVNTGALDPNPTVIEETIIEETILNETSRTETILEETVLNETILSETIIEEIIIAEQTISEILLEDETIDEVILCKTIYVYQDSIDDFSKNSQTNNLFGAGIDISSLLKKVSIGTGVIVTLVVLKSAGLPNPIASIVVAAADESLKFAGAGAVIGSLFGGLTGAMNEIDETGRTSAAIGFATATAGLILTIISFVAAIPSAGTTTISAAAGIKLVIAGVSVLTATAGTAISGYNAIRTFTETDAVDIDWNNIDWDQVGVSAAENAIEHGADGYMWGSIIGAVYGGVEGYEYYQKYNTPYTKYENRLNQTPKEEGHGGRWSGERGESDFILDEPIVLEDGTKISRVTYRNAVPDFSPYQEAQVKISKMTNQRLGPGGNYEKADTALADLWTRTRHNNKTWTAREVADYRTSNNLTWHEMSNMEWMQLVPYEVNKRFYHFGGVSEYNAMMRLEGVADFD